MPLPGSIHIAPAEVAGSLSAPASKSVAQRAIALASMCRGRSRILSPGSCDDVLAAIRVCRSLGARITGDQEGLSIDGGLAAPQEPLNCGESGLGIRLFTLLAATFDQEITLVAEGSLRQRPMDMAEKALQALGAACRSREGRPPLQVRGPLRGGEAAIDGSQGSQVLTGILIASPRAQADVHLRVSRLTSRPYIDTTIQVMRAFGFEVMQEDYSRFYIRSGQAGRPATYRVEGDWSGAAFLLVAGAVAGEAEVSNLDPISTQADRAVLDALHACGARVDRGDEKDGRASFRVARASLDAFDMDATHCPDLFPPLVALAACCRGTSRLQGAGRLHVKESDRAATLIDAFTRMGVHIWQDGDSLLVEGGTIRGGLIRSHGDHRIAMAGAVAALTSRKGVTIEQPEVVNKSWPGFFEDLQRISIRHQHGKTL
jgi:3-phosphoshikimate 1-carboxyvinyltransferase